MPTLASDDRLSGRLKIALTIKRKEPRLNLKVALKIKRLCRLVGTKLLTRRVVARTSATLRRARRAGYFRR